MTHEERQAAREQTARQLLLGLMYYQLEGVNGLARRTKLEHEPRYVNDITAVADLLAVIEAAVLEEPHKIVGPRSAHERDGRSRRDQGHEMITVYAQARRKKGCAQ